MTLRFFSLHGSKGRPFTRTHPSLSFLYRAHQRAQRRQKKCFCTEKRLSRFLWQCEDSKVDALTEALQATVMRWKCKFPAPLPLELYTSSNFIGLFVKEESAEVLKKFAADFAAEAASKAGE